MASRWWRSKRSPTWRRQRRLEIPALRAFAIALVAVGAFATVALYSVVGRPSRDRTEVLVRSVDSEQPSQSASIIPSLSTGLTGSSESGTKNPAEAIRPSTIDLLRPGAEIVSRTDLALDGSTTGQIAVSSRYTVTPDCQPVFADVFSFVAGAWSRVFAASDPNNQYGAALTDPVQAASGCFPKLRLFSAEPAGVSGNALLLLGVTYADTSTRLVIVGWDSTNNATAIRFDWRTGPNGSILRNSNQIQISEDVGVPSALAGAPVTIGRFTQTVSLEDAEARVTSRRLSPTCDRGTIGAGTTRGIPADGTDPLLIIRCSSGSTRAGVPAKSLLNPTGISWADLRDGDAVQVEFDPSSLEPGTIATAFPVVATLTDTAALARHQAKDQPTRQLAPSVRPAAPAPAQPRNAQPAAAGGSNPPAQAPARQPTQRNSGPPAPPAVNVTAPPPPQSPPFAGPPPVAPR